MGASDKSDRAVVNGAASVSALRASVPSAEAGLVRVARSNLRHYIKMAIFQCGADREAALNCLDVIEQELVALDNLVAVLRAAVIASDRVQNPQPCAQDRDA